MKPLEYKAHYLIKSGKLICNKLTMLKCMKSMVSLLHINLPDFIK